MEKTTESTDLKNEETASEKIEVEASTTTRRRKSSKVENSENSKNQKDTKPDDSKKSEELSEEVKTSSSKDSKKEDESYSQKNADDLSISKKYENVYIKRPIPVYYGKNVHSPILGMVYGSCKILKISSDHRWIQIVVGITGLGRTVGWISTDMSPIQYL